MALKDFARSAEALETAERLNDALLRAQLDRTEEQRTLLLDRAPSEWAQLAADLLRPTLVYGAGLLDYEGKERPFVLMHESVAPRGPSLLAEAPATTRSVLAGVVGDQPELESLAVLGVPEPQPYLGPGDAATCWGKQGTLGTLVHTNSGESAFLTAGHFASPLRAAVYSGGTLIGRVSFTLDPAKLAAATVSADVAVVTIERSALASLQGGIAIGSLASAQSGERVTACGSVALSASVMGMMQSCHVDTMSGQWQDVYLTTRDISRCGDSGAPVLLEGTDVLIGHVVGGSPGATTYVETIDCQVKAANVTWP